MKLEPELEAAFLGRSRFVLRCPYDQRSLIAWQIFLDHPCGVEYGRDETWEIERVGYPHDGANVGMPLPGDEPHFRFNIRCTEAECEYRKVLQPPMVKRVIYPLIEGLERQGGGTWIEDNIDGLLRRASRW